MPARVFNPTHVNRRKALFDEALTLAEQGCTIDITAFPVAEGEDAWPAEIALLRYIDSGAAVDRVTISSDGGGCLPVWNEQGEMTGNEVGRPSILPHTLKLLLDQGLSLQQALPAFTSNVAGILRLPDKGRVRQGFAADFIVLDAEHRIDDVVVAGVWHVKDKHQQVFGQFEKTAGNS